MEAYENRAIVKYFYLKGYKPEAIITDMKRVLGEKAPPNSTIYNLVNEFEKSGLTALQVSEVSEKSKQPSSSKVNGIIKAKVKPKKLSNKMSTKVATAPSDSSNNASNLNNTKETNGNTTSARRLRTRNSTGSGVPSGNASGSDSAKKNGERGVGGGVGVVVGPNYLSDSNSNAAVDVKPVIHDDKSTILVGNTTSSNGTSTTGNSGGGGNGGGANTTTSSTGNNSSTTNNSTGGGGGNSSTKKHNCQQSGGGSSTTKKDCPPPSHKHPRSSSTFSLTKNEEFHFDTPMECPVFRPTVEEFKNPLAFISKIRPIAEKCGIAKILPPASWSPPFAVDVDKLKFTPRVQRLNELEAKTRVKLNFLDQIAKFWELQGSSLKIPMVERKALDLYTLHRIVQEEGGMEQTTKDRKWARVANRMNYPSSKSVGATLKAHYERILHPFEIYTSGKVLGVGTAAAPANAANPEVPQVKLEDGTDYKTHEIPTRQQITPPNENNARRSKRFANSSANCGFGGAVRNGGIKGDNKDDIRRDLLNCFNATSVASKMKEAAAIASRLGSAKDQKKAPDPNAALDPLMKYICHICNRGDVEESMLLCDGCDDSYHTFCLLPPLTSIPKGEWLCPRCVVEEVSKPTEAFGFEQADREYTLQEFGQMADSFKMEYFQMPVHMVSTELVEREFWRIVSSIDEDVTVEYGADLHTMDHGSGFPTKSSLYLLPSDQEYAESSWNLNNLPLLEDSILGHINADISGMNAPWMYVGMCFAAFCWHNEDHWSYSINYLHWGEPKTWYGVPGSCAEQFEETMKQAAPELFATQPDLLHQLVTIMNPNILMNNGVPVYRTDQNAGEFVITFPRAYHAGFNQGYNFAEAVNFAPADWLKMGRECINHYSMLRRFCVFSHDELVCKMALEPAKLTFGIATACYIDMAEMVDSEKKLRKSLLEWGVTRAERKAFELIPDDKRHCQECNTTCFLSAVACECTKAIVCLRHYKLLCNCPAEKHTLLYRYTLDEMPLMLQKLKAKAQSFERWLSRCRDIVDASTPTSVTLTELQELCKEAEVKKFPSSLLIDRLNAAVLEAEKCVTVIQQLGINKVRTRSDNSLEAAQYKLTMEELELFVQEIDNLCCIIEEGASVRELLVLGKSFVERATTMLKQSLDKAEEVEMEALINEGNSLRIELHQISSLQIRLKQCKWYKRANGLRNSNTKLSYLDIKTLLSLAEAEVAPNDSLIEREVRKLHEIGASIETWEDQAEKYFKKTIQQSELSDIEEFLKTAININGQVPSYGPLKDALRKSRDWLKSVEQLQSNDHYPYCHTLEDIIKRGSSIQIKLDELSRMQEHVKSAKEWKRSTELAFLKPNTFYQLLEVLLPRNDAINIDSDLKRPFKDDFLKEMNPSQIVESFKQAEDKELRDMRELRRQNMTKNPLRDKYCLCKSTFNGNMYNCKLCRDWFHESCVPPPPPEPEFFAISGNNAETKWLCPSCVRSKRPRLETILPLLVSLQQLPIRLPEDEALRCLAERAMNWQDRARKALTSPDVTAALEAIANHTRKQQKRKNTCGTPVTTGNGTVSNSSASPDGNSVSNSNASVGSGGPNNVSSNNGRKIRRSSQRNSKDAASSDDDDDEGRLRIVEEPLSNDEEDSVPSNNNKEGQQQQQNQDKTQQSQQQQQNQEKTQQQNNNNQHETTDQQNINEGSSDGLGGEGNNNSLNELQMLLSTSETENLDELMMEGDLLEVSLDETHELWRLLAMVQPPNCTEAAALVEQHKIKASKQNTAQLSINANSAAEDSNDSLLVQSSPNSNSTSSLSGRTSTGGSNSKKRRSLEPSGGAVPRKKTATPSKQPTSAKKSSRKSDLGKQQQDDNAENFTPTKQTNGNSSSASSQKKRKRISSTAQGTGSTGSNTSSGGGTTSGNQHKKSSQQRTQVAQQEDDEEEECRADICYKPTGREVDWVQCDGGCNEWFHMFCVGLIRSQVKSDDDYYCMRCKKSDTPSATGQKTPSATAKGRTQAAR